MKLYRVKLHMLCAVFSAAAWGQSQPDALSGFQQNAERRSTEWSTLAVNLEQRVTRLLPCDPRVRGAIEETGRASEARIAALNTYWMAVAGKSRDQTESIARLLTQEEGRKAEWTNEAAHAGEERAAVAEQNGFLAVSANRLPALASVQTSLTTATQTLQQVHARIQARESAGGSLVGELRDLLTAAQSRQNDIDAQLKSLGTEGARWGAYYDARLKRAQMECAITNPRAEPGQPAQMQRQGKKKK